MPFGVICPIPCKLILIRHYSAQNTTAARDLLSIILRLNKHTKGRLKAGLFFRRPSSPLLRIGVLAIDRLLAAGRSRQEEAPLIFSGASEGVPGSDLLSHGYPHYHRR